MGTIIFDIYDYFCIYYDFDGGAPIDHWLCFFEYVLLSIVKEHSVLKFVWLSLVFIFHLIVWVVVEFA